MTPMAGGWNPLEASSLTSGILAVWISLFLCGLGVSPCGHTTVASSLRTVRLQTMVAQGSTSRSSHKEGRSHLASLDPASEVTRHHFCPTPWVEALQVHPDARGEDMDPSLERKDGEEFAATLQNHHHHLHCLRILSSEKTQLSESTGSSLFQDPTSLSQDDS